WEYATSPEPGRVPQMIRGALVFTAFLVLGVGRPTAQSAHQHGASDLHGGSVVAVTFAELRHTNDQLAAARKATARYQDGRVAEAEGYRAVGPNVPGMGTHYVRHTERTDFSVTEPPILLYERDATASNGLRLVGVSYLLVVPAGADGQPVESPFPK